VRVPPAPQSSYPTLVGVIGIYIYIFAPAAIIMELEPSRYDVVYPGTCVVCGPFRGVCLGWCGVCWQQWVRLQPPSLLCWYPQELRFFYAVRELQGATSELREVRGLDSCFLFDPPPRCAPMAHS